MNSDKQILKQAVKTYYASKQLSDQQTESLQALLKTHPLQQASHRSAIKWISSLAASLLLFVVVLGYMQTPTLITAAYADIIKDADTYNGMVSPIHHWMNNNHIADIPPQYKVEMSKYCQLEQYKTTHLRIAGATQGTLHLFFHTGEPPAYWINRSGNDKQMSWQLLRVQDNLTLIVMHTHDIREETVQHILDEILPILNA